ncbi:hypothetical protein [Oceanobacillus senegalensis]|uniref:hypothetical protein n=1 Tax=Oceanobacillus senegalensis TaxID=1936063 RepID=UPI000A30AB36|nr:hypothetical protein [Oceanobacillus senegalensis]
MENQNSFTFEEIFQQNENRIHYFIQKLGIIILEMSLKEIEVREGASGGAVKDWGKQARKKWRRWAENLRSGKY